MHVDRKMITKDRHLSLILLIRTTDIHQKALLTFSTLSVIRMSVNKKALAGRFRWLLETMMRKQGIDLQELDYELDYWENKAAIESKFMTVLVLKLKKLTTF